MIKLVLTDLDDTLIPFGSPQAPREATDAMAAALAAGVHVGPVSGRTLADMSWMLPGHEECYQTGAFSNGQLVRVDGETVLEKRVAGEVLVRLGALLEETDAGFLAVYDSSTIEVVSLDRARFEQNRPDTFRQSYRVVDALPEDGCLKCNIHCAGSFEGAVALRGELGRAFPELSFVLPTQNFPLIDIVPAGWGKGDAVLCIARELGISPNEVAVFGDSDNDLSMIAAVPNSVAVANASDAVREAARWHIGAAGDMAVANALLDIAQAASLGAMPAFMTEGRR